MKKVMIASAVAAVMSVGVFAAVTFDAASGMGFVGKGDVQTVFGLNNSRMQVVHNDVKFSYDVTTQYSFTCEWYTGPDHNIKHHTTDETETFGINGTVASDSRKTGQWTGWNLTGYENAGPGSGTRVPQDSDCGAEGNEMKSIVEGSVVATPLGGGLYAEINGNRRLIQ